MKSDYEIIKEMKLIYVNAYIRSEGARKEVLIGIINVLNDVLRILEETELKKID